MSWTDFFPVFCPAPEESTALRDAHGGLFDFGDLLHPSAAGHIVATALYPLGGESHFDLVPEPGESARVATCRRSLLEILAAAQRLQRKPGPAGDEVALRVYLDPRLQRFAAELGAAGCEVQVMAHPSEHHCPGVLWRFLALEEPDKWLTVVQPHHMSGLRYDILRSAETRRAGLGGWRIPDYRGERRLSVGVEGYRPIRGDRFGSRGGYPMRFLLGAFVEAHLSKEIVPEVRLPGGKSRIPSAAWPDRGFDEWFLLATLYPLLAERGLLTFLSGSGPDLQPFLALDIEFATWLNPKSEIVLDVGPPRGEVLGLDAAPGPPPGTIRVRPDCSVVRRERKVRRLHGFQDEESVEIPGILEFRGDLGELWDWVADSLGTTWLVDASGALTMTGDHAEIYLDAYLDRVDLAVTSSFFIALGGAEAEWACLHLADPAAWREGSVIKVPKIEGPMTLWRRSAGIDMMESWRRDGRPVRLELYLELMCQKGEFRWVEVPLEPQGWKPG